MERRPNAFPPPDGRRNTPSSEHPLERAAKRLGIPTERLANPTVRTFLGFYIQLERMQQQMGTAATYHPLFFTPDEIEQEIHNQIATGIAPEQAVLPQLEPSLAERYTAAEHLIRIALVVFRDGFGGYEVNPDQVRRSANVALARFGLYTDYAPLEVVRGIRDHESETNVPDTLRRWANEQTKGEDAP